MSPPSRRLQTKPVITCLKTFLISYSLIFWVSWPDVKMGDSSQLRGATKGLKASKASKASRWRGRKKANKQTKEKPATSPHWNHDTERDEENKHGVYSVWNKKPAGVEQSSLSVVGTKNHLLTNLTTCPSAATSRRSALKCHRYFSVVRLDRGFCISNVFSLCLLLQLFPPLSNLN